jgi:hypothetical protein
MKKHIVSSTIVALFSLGLLTIQFAQSAFTQPPRPDRPGREQALGLIRSINTAEAGERFKNHSYSSWQTLLEHQSKLFDQWLVMEFPQQAVHFGDMPEILPGWSLRLNVHADSKGYDVRLEDLTDKKCGYAIVSDESGVIRQSKAIDCDIQ